jgi:hypothetical protein
VGNEWRGPRNRYTLFDLLATSTFHQNISLIVTAHKDLRAFLRGNINRVIECGKNYLHYLLKSGNYSSTIVSLILDRLCVLVIIVSGYQRSGFDSLHYKIF